MMDRLDLMLTVTELSRAINELSADMLRNEKTEYWYQRRAWYRLQNLRGDVQQALDELDAVFEAKKDERLS